MPTAVTELPVPVSPPRKVWTRAEVDALASTGLFDQQRLELIEGELINKMGKLPPHVVSLVLLMKWLTRVFGWDFIYPEAPIDVAPEDNPTSEPQPDLVVLKRDIRTLAKEHPRAGDIQLLIEVADTSLSFDLTTKASLYARAGIVEYWVLDIGGRRMIVHREPRGGRYASVAAYSGEESVAPLAAPQSSLRVGDAFPG